MFISGEISPPSKAVVKALKQDLRELARSSKSFVRVVAPFERVVSREDRISKYTDDRHILQRQKYLVGKIMLYYFPELPPLTGGTNDEYRSKLVRYKQLVNDGLIAVAAIHEGRNKDDPSLSNPHVHILVTMRKVDSNGFSKTKERDFHRKKSLNRLRESLEREINRAYERCDMPQRVSSKSYRAQGRTDIEPRKRLGRAEWERMNQNGERIRLYREYQEKRNPEKEEERERLYSFFRMR